MILNWIFNLYSICIAIKDVPTDIFSVHLRLRHLSFVSSESKLLPVSRCQSILGCTFSCSCLFHWFKRRCSRGLVSLSGELWYLKYIWETRLRSWTFEMAELDGAEWLRISWCFVWLNWWNGTSCWPSWM